VKEMKTKGEDEGGQDEEVQEGAQLCKKLGADQTPADAPMPANPSRRGSTCASGWEEQGKPILVFEGENKHGTVPFSSPNCTALQNNLQYCTV